MSGIEKEIDVLGRIVIPMSYRKKLGLKQNDKVILSLIDNQIIISASDSKCLLCGANTDKKNTFSLCSDCITKIRELQ